jgi:hypothetical protein
MELIKEEFADIYGGRKKVRLNKKEKVLIKLIKTELTKKIGGLGENESKDLDIDKQVKIDLEDMTKKFIYGAYIAKQVNTNNNYDVNDYLKIQDYHDNDIINFIQQLMLLQRAKLQARQLQSTEPLKKQPSEKVLTLLEKFLKIYVFLRMIITKFKELQNNSSSSSSGYSSSYGSSQSSQSKKRIISFKAVKSLVSELQNKFTSFIKNDINIKIMKITIETLSNFTFTYNIDEQIKRLDTFYIDIKQLIKNKAINPTYYILDVNNNIKESNIKDEIIIFNILIFNGTDSSQEIYYIDNDYKLDYNDGDSSSLNSGIKKKIYKATGKIQGEDKPEKYILHSSINSSIN